MSSRLRAHHKAKARALVKENVQFPVRFLEQRTQSLQRRHHVKGPSHESEMLYAHSEGPTCAVFGNKTYAKPDCARMHVTSRIHRFICHTFDSKSGGTGDR